MNKISLEDVQRRARKTAVSMEEALERDAGKGSYYLMGQLEMALYCLVADLIGDEEARRLMPTMSPVTGLQSGVGRSPLACSWCDATSGPFVVRKDAYGNPRPPLCEDCAPSAGVTVVPNMPIVAGDADAPATIITQEMH